MNKAPITTIVDIPIKAKGEKAWLRTLLESLPEGKAIQISTGGYPGIRATLSRLRSRCGICTQTRILDGVLYVWKLDGGQKKRKVK